MHCSMCRIFALVSSQGTACSETALCVSHTCQRASIESVYCGSKAPDAPVPGSWTECTDNDVLACVVCGFRVRECEYQYKIRASELDDDGEILFWSNDDGWVNFESATVFSGLEHRLFRLPTGGQWHRVA